MGWEEFRYWVCATHELTPGCVVKDSEVIAASERDDTAHKLAQMMLDGDVAERVYIIDQERHHVIWDSLFDGVRER